MSPFQLLFSAILLFWYQEKFKKSFWTFLGASYFTIYILFLVNYYSAFPFGPIEYNRELGPSLLHIPLTIAILWLIIIYSAGIITARLPLAKLYKALVGAFLVLLMNMALEPAAQTMMWWQYASGDGLILNYTATFVISFFLLIFFHLSRFRKKNNLAPLFFIVLLLFFTMVNIVGIAFIGG